MNGNRIRQLRQEKKLTIEEFAEITGFTPSYISQLERNKLEPSLAALTKISKVLDVSLYYFLEEESSKMLIIKKNERKTVSSDNKADISFLTHISETCGIKPEFYVYEVILEPNQWDSKTLNIINCHKCIIVKKGTVLIEFSNSNEILQTGDSIYIDSNMPHRCYNPTSSEIEILCITSALDLS